LVRKQNKPNLGYRCLLRSLRRSSCASLPLSLRGGLRLRLRESDDDDRGGGDLSRLSLPRCPPLCLGGLSSRPRTILLSRWCFPKGCSTRGAAEPRDESRSFSPPRTSGDDAQGRGGAGTVAPPGPPRGDEVFCRGGADAAAGPPGCCSCCGGEPGILDGGCGAVDCSGRAAAAAAAAAASCLALRAAMISASMSSRKRLGRW
jgi:hypothetical protein